MTRVKRFAFAAAVTVTAVGSAVLASPAEAAGGSGASMCSLATGPQDQYNIGRDIRSHQPFGGDNNPGFAGPGVSPFCRPGSAG
jgi:hypothetical protein